MRRILIVGEVYDKHAYRFISKLKENNSTLEIDVFSYTKMCEPPECAEFCDNVFYPVEVLPVLYKLRYVGPLLRAWNFRRSLQLGKEYDAIIVLWVYTQNLFAYNAYKKLAKNLILVPLGSDVLRIGRFTRLFLRPIYQNADYVVLSPIDFKLKVQKYFGVEESHIVMLDFGSSLIDLLTHNSITKEEAKKQLDISDKFVLTIGYNASIAQNHLSVIQQIDSVRDKLPSNILLLLPMTYPSTMAAREYVRNVREYVQMRGYSYMVIEEYLDEKKLLYIRKSSDIFIHAQLTDAGCASIQEYILSGSIVLNAGWLRYSELESYGIPYFIFNTINDLGLCLLEAVKKRGDFKYSPSLLKKISQKGWNYQIKLWLSFLDSIK